MLSTSTVALKVLAAVVWYIGGVVLLLKGLSLLREAIDLRHGWQWPAVAAGIGVIVGALKGRLIFVKSCRRNLDRIARLREPRVWEFFRPAFSVFLVVMILTGATLSRLAHGHYAFLIGVAILDLAISTALFASSAEFCKHKPSRT